MKALTAAPTLPGSWPGLGHAPALLRDPLRLLAGAGRLGPVTLARLGPVRAFVVTDPALIRRILVADAAGYDKGFQFDTLRALIGDGVGTSTGARHRRSRRLLRPAFDHAGVAHQVEDFGRQTTAFLESRWDPAARSGYAVDAAVELRMLSMRIVSHSMSGSEVAADEVMRVLPELLSGIGRRALLPVRALDRLPTRGNRRFDRALRSVHAIADAMVADARAGLADAAADKTSNLLTTLLSAVDEDGTGLDDAQAHDEIMTLLMAGTETTAGVMAWTLHILAQNPALQRSLREEILAETDGSAPGIEQMRRLAAMERVVKEVLRLYPPGWMLGRRPLGEMRIGEVAVPAGSQVLLNFYGLHRDPRAFADPEAFEPDRWLEADPEAIGDYYRPFGHGPHGCLGEGYAWAEMFGVLSGVLTRYRLAPQPGVVVRPVARTTLHPDQVPLRLTRIR